MKILPKPVGTILHISPRRTYKSYLIDAQKKKSVITCSYASDDEPSNCNFARVTLTVDKKRSIYCTARKSVSSINLYSSATSISQSIRIVRIGELMSDWCSMKFVSAEKWLRKGRRLSSARLTRCVDMFDWFQVFEYWLAVIRPKKIKNRWRHFHNINSAR